MVKFSLLEVSGESCANCLTLLPVVNRLARERGLPVEHLEVNGENTARVRLSFGGRMNSGFRFGSGPVMGKARGVTSG